MTTAVANPQPDVFLSFRAVDTPHGFPNYLYDALSLEKLILFRDDQDIERGESISPSLLTAIENAKIAIVFLTKSYATSTWTLNELLQIISCMKTRKLLVFPVFFHVDPSDVRHLRRSYGEAMARHEHKLGKHSETVEKWKFALYELTKLSGWHVQSDEGQYQAELVQKVVDWVIQSLPRYDVFLSFYGPDTRDSFTGFLYNALRERGFNTFLSPNEGLESGNQTSQFDIIEQSKILIVVFSEDYAQSHGCMEEIVKILECKNLGKQMVWPIFYNLPPSNVRNQTSTSSFGKAMAAHEKRFGKESDKVVNWRKALYEFADLKGWHFKTGYEYEYQTIQKIVELVDKSLPLPRYDIFLSFRGQDTRHTFTGYLYNALCKKGFKTFMDDEALETGDKISFSLNNAIEGSRLSIIVFSENYACSRWALDELVDIMKCKKMKNHQVWPIFYRVEPSDVWHQRNSYEDAMTVQESRYVMDPGKVEKWRKALSEVANLEACAPANLAAWHYERGSEYEFIQRIVDKVSKI